MVKKIVPSLILLLGAVVLQTLLPLISGELTIANPYLAVLATLAIRSGRLGGLLWGAALGIVCDAYFSPYIGFHGLAFTLVGYALGWLGSKLLLRGVLPIAFFSWIAYLLDGAMVAGLYVLLGLPLSRSFWIEALIGSLMTAALTAIFEPIARSLYPKGAT